MNNKKISKRQYRISYKVLQIEDQIKNKTNDNLSKEQKERLFRILSLMSFKEIERYNQTGELADALFNLGILNSNNY
uniref:Uncharacterized protein n=1 Tax=viral metagenome TaxID=1070528 RepID=A0A6M3L7B1_9ZZZZ